MELRKKLLMLGVLALLLPLVQFSSTSGAVTGTPTAAVGLAITSTPPKLPADGGQYSSVVVSLVDKSNLPSVALSDVLVFLSSSLSNVGTVPSSVIIPAGQAYATVTFTTTTTSGETTITASSSGLASATTQISTVTPSGFPSEIKVFATPNSLLARPTDTGTLTLELTDATGLPAKAASNVQILLFSSNVGIVALGSSNATIKANQVLGVASFRTSFLPGTATITASSSGYISGSDVVSVVGPAPLVLKLTPQPDKIVVGSTARVIISLTDMSGNPARAPTAIPITLTSSNLNAASVQTSATIAPGQIYTVASYTAASSPGNATLTATSPGLQSSSVNVLIAKPGSQDTLKVFLGPNPVLSDNQTYSAVLVAVVSKNGSAAVASTDITVQLTSSSSAVGNVPSTVIIPAGSTYVTTTFQSTFASGQTLITASASNLLPSQASLSTYGPVPAKLTLAGIPQTLQADGGSYQALSVGLASSSGGPAVAATDIVVQLSSSRADIVSVNSEAVIRQGAISTVVEVQTSSLPGSANITASAIGLGSDTQLFSSVIPAPSKLAVYAAPSVSFTSTSRTSPRLVVQLQDSAGNPARARQTTDLVVTSSNTQILNQSMSLSIASGQDYAAGYLNNSRVGVGTITAASPGLGSSSVNLQLIQYPVTGVITATKSVIYANQTASLLFTASFLGTPISNATVTWVPVGGIAIPANGTTNVAGKASSVFKPNGPGAANVTAILTTPALGSLKYTAPVTVLQVPPKPPLTAARFFREYLYYVVAAVAAVVVAGVYLLRLRSQKAKAELEAGFEAVS